MIRVNIHIFQGTGTEEEGKVNILKNQVVDDDDGSSLTRFKNHLLTIHGHVGISFPDISFPDNTTIYGYGPDITRKVLDELEVGDEYMESDKRRTGTTRWTREDWTATNFLFRKDSPKFIGKITKDTSFFDPEQTETFPLIALVPTPRDALEILYNIKKPYVFTDDPNKKDQPAIYGLPGKKYDPRENCLTAIFNHLPLTYQNGKQVVLTTVYMLSQTLKELHQGTREACEKNEKSGSTGESKEGGRRRRKKRKSRKSKRRRRKTKRKRRVKRRRRTRRR
tara:strand:- start:4838 stop:5677 length:840 start_codon:yes stop_codon:yes gene_type:complete